MLNLRVLRSRLYAKLPDNIKPFAASLYQRYLRLRFRPVVKTVRLADGVAFQFKIADALAKAWYGSDTLGPTVRWMIRLAQPGDHVVEVGAHQGYTTLCLSLTVSGAGLVHAFEPDAYSFRRLTENLKLNGITNVVTGRQAVGSVAGQVSFHEGAVAVARNRQHGKIVEQVALESLFSTWPVHMLKVDVEGYECQVLEGARNILAQRPKLMIEVHMDKLADYGASVEDVMRFLDSESYLYLAQLGESEDAYVTNDPISVSRNSYKIQLYGVPREDMAGFQRLLGGPDVAGAR